MPRWIDAPEFDIRDHVQALAVAPPAQEAEVLSAVEGIRRRCLGRTRPLWEMWFLTELPVHRIALFVRMHHCIADGMAGVATISKFLDATTDAVFPLGEPRGPRRRCRPKKSC